MKQQILPPLAAVQIYTKRYLNIWDKTERLLERAKENPQTDAKRWKCSIVTTNTNARSVKPNQIATTPKRKPLSFTFQKQQASLSPIIALKD